MESGFFTWTQLGTSAGAVAATMLIVQFTKEINPFKRMHTRLWAYIVATVLLFVATIINGISSSTLTVSGILMCPLNALMVAMTATGSVDTVNQIVETKKKTTNHD